MRSGLRRVLPFLCVLALPIGCGEPARGPGAQTYDAEGRLLERVDRAGPLPNVIVLVLDAVRADALDPVEGVWPDGATVPMPFLASLAARGVRFTNAVAAAPWTLPSLTSVLTGQLPSEHGQTQVRSEWHLSPSVTTYAEILGSAYGYETAAFANGEWYQQSASSLLQGFGFVRPVFALQGTEAAIAAWNRQRDPARPFFLFLHTFEPHDPYGAANHPWPPVRYEPLNTDGRLRPDQVDAATIFRQAFLSATQAQVLHARMGPELGGVLQRYKWRGFAEHPDPGLAEDLRRAYWDGVRWVDGLLATTCRQLEASGLLENTLLVVTSDHGEAFGEHGALAHGLRLYDELLRVPLVMVGPGDFSGGSVVEEDVGLVDVLPTFLDWAGLAPLRGVAGRSALEIVHGGSWCRPVVSEERLDAVSTGDDVNAVRISARTHQWKYIVTLDLRGGEVREEAYDLLVDPEELDDLAEGTGRLPQDRMFDPCLCEAVESVRARVWRRAEAGDGEVYTTPYGASSAGGRTARPPPCNAGE